MAEQIRRGLIVFREDHTEPPFRKAHLLPIPEEFLDEKEPLDMEADDDDQNDAAGLQVMPSVIHKQAQVSVRLLRTIFDGRKVFSNPKDHEVIMRLIRYCTGPDDLILDSFAGSGTTGHAVLQINQEDQSNRRFVLVEMDTSIASEVTAERLRRVIGGFANKPPLGGGFRFCTLSEPLFDEKGDIRGTVAFPDLASHVFFVETGAPIPKRATAKTPLLGTHSGAAVYLLYNGILGDKAPRGGNVLTREVLAEIPPHDGPKVVYGTGCLLSPQRLKREGVTFRQIPYEVKVS